MSSRRALVLAALGSLAALGQPKARPPPTFVPLDFVPHFSFAARVAALDPPPAEEKEVRTIMEWGWGQRAGETVGFAWGARDNFTNATAEKWAKSYPNSFGLRPQYFTGKRGDDEVLVTHLYFCHIGTFPSRNDTERAANQTTAVELSITLEGVTSTIAADLLWGGEEGSCDDLGVVVGRRKSTGKHFVESFRDYNNRRYWEAFEALPQPRTPPKKFPILDSFRTGDGDIHALRDALRASKRLGLHGVSSGGPAWLQRQELGYALTAGGAEVALEEWSPVAPDIGAKRKQDNLTAWAAATASSTMQRGFARSEIQSTPIHDEPGMRIPDDLPPVGNASFADVTRSWKQSASPPPPPLPSLPASL